MPKPVGSTGATKLKMLAIICYLGDGKNDNYGYNIWRCMQDHFHLYLDDNDIGNVYHHLSDMCEQELVTRKDPTEKAGRCFYMITPKGLEFQPRFQSFLEILEQEGVAPSRPRPSPYRRALALAWTLVLGLVPSLPFLQILTSQ